MLLSTKVDGRLRLPPEAQITEPQALMVTEVTDEVVANLAYAMAKAREFGQPVLPIAISSFGGNVHSALALQDMIECSQIPIATIAIGKAMSAGAMLLASGTKGHRYVAPGASIMFHEISTAMQGYTHEITVESKEMRRLSKEWLSRFVKCTGQTETYWRGRLRSVQNGNLYMTAKDAVASGLADHIGIPELEIRVELNYAFGVPSKGRKS